jgi:hypothetical protein
LARRDGTPGGLGFFFYLISDEILKAGEPCGFFFYLISDEILKAGEPCGFFFYLISDEIRYTKKYIILKSHWSHR